MDRLFCMQVFIRVVEHGAFARAADALGISRATATTAITELEKRLGVRLLNRTTRRLSLTDEGQTYYQSCVRLLGDIAEAEDGLLGTRRAPRGRLRLSIPQSFLNGLFYPALTRFGRQYPELEVEIVLTDRAVNLIEEGIDCAIRGVEVPRSALLVVKHLSATRWLTCASPEYIAEHGSPSDIAALSSHNCIRFASQSTGRQRDWLFNVAGKLETYVPSGKFRLTSLDAVQQLALSGAGIAQIPDVLGFDAVLDGRLRPVLIDHVAAAPSLVLVYPGNRYLPAKVRAFSEFVTGLFPADGWWPAIEAHCRGADVAAAR